MLRVDMWGITAGGGAHGTVDTGVYLLQHGLSLLTRSALKMKRCSRCKIGKPFTEFGKNKAQKDGLGNQCSECTRLSAKETRSRHREALNAKARVAYALDPEPALLRAAEYRKSNPEKVKERRQRYKKENAEKVAKAGALYYLKNKERHDATTRRWYSENKETHNAATQKWYEANKMSRAATIRAWVLNNKGRVAARSAKRRAAKALRTPQWLTEECFYGIQAFYIEARRLTDLTGITHEVDHIIPLQGKYVSGLHVPSNLQVLPGIQNRKKSARFSPQ